MRICSLLLAGTRPSRHGGTAIAGGSGGSMGSGGSRPSMSAPAIRRRRRISRGLEALKASRFADAKKSFGKVLGVAPRDANTNFLAGLADAGLNDLKAAANYYDKAARPTANGHRAPGTGA